MTAAGLEALARAILSRPGPGRTTVAVAGAPGSGKSTFAERLAARLNEAAPGSAAILPMDGFHYDDAVLRARGRLARKGAPDTFDVGGLAHALGRLRRDEEDEVAVPVFDRALEVARAGARVIPRAVRTVVVEGNYLLLGAAPWSALAPLFDVTAMLAVPEAELRRRLVARWEGFGLAPAEVAAKVEGNDLPNGRRVAAESVPAQHLIAD